MASKRILYYRLQVLINIVIMWVVFAFLFLYNVILIEKDFACLDRNDADNEGTYPNPLANCLPNADHR